MTTTSPRGGRGSAAERPADAASGVRDAAGSESATDQAPAREVVLVLDGVTKRYARTTAIDSVDLEVHRGETLVIVGPSGCGKSTLLRAVAGLVDIDTGTVALAGRMVSGGARFVPAERRDVGIVFQDLALFPHLTVADNIGFGLRYREPSPGGRSRGAGAASGGAVSRGALSRGAAAGSEKGRVAEMLDLVGMTDKARRFPHELSGGEQQRVALARALALDPAIVLLDEPFSHLDRGLAVRVRTEAMAVLREAGATVVLVTHDQDEALAVGDRVAVMHRARIAQVGEPAAIYHQPVDEFVATFVGEADFLPGERHGDLARTALGELPVRAGADGPVRVMVRPHDLTVRALHPADHSAGDDSASDDSAADPPVAGAGPGGAGVVLHTEFRGGDVLHLVELDSGPVVRALTPHGGACPVGSRIIVPPPIAHALTAFLT